MFRAGIVRSLIEDKDSITVRPLGAFEQQKFRNPSRDARPTAVHGRDVFRDGKQVWFLPVGR